MRRHAVSAAAALVLLVGASWVGAAVPAERSATPHAAAALAPGPAEWEATLALAEARAGRAEALSVAALRLQNAWAAHLAEGGGGCRSEEARPLGARLVPFADAWRDAVQDARVQVDRVSRMRATVTVAPLLDDDAAARADAVVDRVAKQVRSYAEYRAWHQRHAGNLRACGAPTPTAGLRPPASWQLDGQVPILAIGGGVVCPLGVPAEGVVLVDRSACWSAEGCDCAPDPVHPGAVIGPPVDATGPTPR